MPVGNILVGNTRCHVEHDNTALAVDVVSITKTAKLLLTSSVPDIELNRSQVLRMSAMYSSILYRARTYCGEAKRVNFHTQSGNVLLLEFSSQVALDEGGLFNSFVSTVFGNANSDDDDIDIDEDVAKM